MTKSLKALCVLFFAVILLAGCRGAEHSELVTDFKADFTACYRGQELKGSVTYNRQGRMNMRLSSPGTLDGLSIGCSDGELRLSKDGMQCTADEAYLPSTSLPAGLKNVLDEICREQENGRLVLNDGKAAVGDWKLTAGENGFIVSLECPDGKIEFINAAGL